MAVKLTKASIGKKYRCRNGKLVTIIEDPDPTGWHKFMCSEGFYRGVSGGLFSFGAEDEWDLVAGPIESKGSLRPPGAGRPRATKNRGETSMKKDQKTVRYFVGRFKTKDGKIVYRVMRERKVKGRLLTRTVQEQYAHNGWVKPKGGFKKCSPYVANRKEAREHKGFWEGKVKI